MVRSSSASTSTSWAHPWGGREAGEPGRGESWGLGSERGAGLTGSRSRRRGGWKSLSKQFWASGSPACSCGERGRICLCPVQGGNAATSGVRRGSCHPPPQTHVSVLELLEGPELAAGEGQVLGEPAAGGGGPVAPEAQAPQPESKEQQSQCWPHGACVGKCGGGSA